MTKQYRGIIPPLNVRKDLTTAIQNVFLGGDDKIERAGLLVIAQDILILNGSEYTLLRAASIEVKNIHDTPNAHFAVDREQFREVQALPNVISIVGVVHTHSGGMSFPSKADIKGLPSDLIGAVYCISKQSVRFYDCDSLIRVYRTTI